MAPSIGREQRVPVFSRAANSRAPRRCCARRMTANARLGGTRPDTGAGPDLHGVAQTSKSMRVKLRTRALLRPEAFSRRRSRCAENNLLFFDLRAGTGKSFFLTARSNHGRARSGWPLVSILSPKWRGSGTWMIRMRCGASWRVKCPVVSGCAKAAYIHSKRSLICYHASRCHYLLS